MRPSHHKIALNSLLLAAVILLIEGALQLGALLSPRLEGILLPARKPPLYLPDPDLGHRPNPRFPDHDRKGFRNAVVPAHTDIVALGDSQTYGISIPREKAWPQQFAALSGRSVYSMAFGGYGPGHSLLLMPEALKLKPTVIIEALYSGNDLYDCFSLVYYKGKLPAFRSADRAVLLSMRSAEERESMEYASYRHGGRLNGDIPPLPVANFSPLPALPVKQANAPKQETVQQPSGKPSAVRVFFAERAALYGLLRAIKQILTTPAAPAVPAATPDWDTVAKDAEKQPDVYQPFVGKHGRTVFMPRYRTLALDMGDPRIREGFRIAMASIGEADAMAKSRNIVYIVLGIPTTEYVFADEVKATKWRSRDYEELVRHEQRFWKDVKAYLTTKSIPFIDALPALQRQIEQSPQPYPMDANGHPNEFGYRAIAGLIADSLRKDGLFH